MILPSDIPAISSRLHERVAISDDTLQSLCRLLTKRCVPKRSLLVSEGSMAGKAFFIEHGMTRSYWLVDGVEHTTSFSTEGSIVFSMDEMYYDKPSEEFVEAVDDLVAYEVRIVDFRELVRSRIDLALWWGLIHQDEYRRLHRSHKERLSLPAAARYAEFESQFPEVCRRGRLTDIASYLGITLSTLSRIRGMK